MKPGSATFHGMAENAALAERANALCTALRSRDTCRTALAELGPLVDGGRDTPSNPEACNLLVNAGVCEALGSLLNTSPVDEACVALGVLQSLTNCFTPSRAHIAPLCDALVSLIEGPNAPLDAALVLRNCLRPEGGIRESFLHVCNLSLYETMKTMTLFSCRYWHKWLAQHSCRKELAAQLAML